MSLSVVELVKLRLSEEIERAKETMSEGKLNDTLYRYACGHIKGYKDAIAIIDQIVEELRKENS